MLFGFESAPFLMMTGIEPSVLFSCDLGEAVDKGILEDKDLEC